jgi:hypothetical protein
VHVNAYCVHMGNIGKPLRALDLVPLNEDEAPAAIEAVPTGSQVEAEHAGAVQ